MSTVNSAPKSPRSMADPAASLPASATPFRRTSIPLVPLLPTLVMIFAIAAFAYWTQYGVAKSRYWVLHSYRVQGELQALKLELAELRGTAPASAISADPTQVQLLRKHADKLSSITQELSTLTADNPIQQARLREFETSSEGYVAKLEKIADATSGQARLSPGATAAVRELDVQELQLDDRANAMDEEERILLDRRLAKGDHLFWRNGSMFGLAFVAALILLAYNFRLLTREVASTKELERLQRENAQGYRSLSARILELQDAERRKVARELHDSVRQYLLGLKISLEQFQHNNSSRSDEEAKLLAEILDLTDRCISEVRTVSHLLHPPLLDEVGLESAAQWYAEGFAARCGLQVSLKIAKIEGRLPKEVELTLGLLRLNTASLVT